MIQFDMTNMFFYLLGGSTTYKRSPFVASRSPTSPGEVLPDAEAESLGSGRDAWLG